MSAEFKEWLWSLVPLALVCLIFRREIADDWRIHFPPKPRVPPPAGGHWRFRHGR